MNCACRYYGSHALPEPGKEHLYPLLRVGTELEYRSKHGPHHKQKDGESKPAVGNKAVNAVGVLVGVLCSRFVCLLQGTVYETIFGTIDGRFGIHTHLRLYLLCALLGQGLPSLHFKAGVKVAQCLLVIFEQFQCPVAHGELLRQVIGLVHGSRERCNLLLDDASVVYVNVAYGVVPALKQFNHSVEQLVESLVVACNGGYHWNTHHAAKVNVIDLGALCQQLVIHVQCNHSAYVHVNELCSEVEVAFEVRCHNRIYDYVGHLFIDVTAHIYLLGRIGRNGVCARQVGEVDAVALVVEAAGLGINGHAAVVAYMFVLVGKCVEYGCLAAVGVAHQCNVNHIPSHGGVVVGCAALSAASRAAFAQRHAVVCGCGCHLALGIFLGKHLNHGSLVAAQ